MWVNNCVFKSLLDNTLWSLWDAEMRYETNDKKRLLHIDCRRLWQSGEWTLKREDVPLLFVLSFLQNKVKPSLWVSSRPTSSGHFLSILVRLLSPLYDCATLRDDEKGRWPWPRALNIHMTWESALMKHQTDVFINSLSSLWHTVRLTLRDGGDFEPWRMSLVCVFVCVCLKSNDDQSDSSLSIPCWGVWRVTAP